ncbi:MAG: nickel pincer cofactor biosynthesis protein LarC [Candidatus Thorarchaeota archaeon]
MADSKILVIDPQMAGIAGDMFVAALLDLGADIDTVISAMEATVEYVPDCKKVKVTPQRVTRSHVGGLYLNIEIEESYTTRSGKVLIDAVSSITNDLNLSEPAKMYANRVISLLVESEATIHHQSSENVHLHGAGSVDTVLDIIGAAVALEQLALVDPAVTSYFVLPIAVGGGTFPSGHGQLAAPGPAVTNILTKAKFLFRGGPLDRELATPTGISLLAALEPVSTQMYPLLRPRSVGYGAGTGELPDIPNLLRLVIGDPISPMRLYQDQIIILETNVDDVSGETLGYIIDRLMQSGAKDVTVLPTTTKKNRPGHLISVIAAPEHEEILTHLLIVESGSLGVRVMRSDRHLLARETRIIQIKLGKQKVSVRVKIATDRTGEVLQVKAEYEDVKKAAETTGEPLVEITRRAEALARRKFKSQRG